MLDISDEWKAHFPISSVFKPPLLKPATTHHGPLHFTPTPQTATQLFISPSLSPPLLSPPPFLSLPRFIATSTTTLSSTSTTLIGLDHPLNDAASQLGFNRLVFLKCRSEKVLVLFFPTNDNSDQVGFLVLRVENGGLCVKGNDVLRAGNRLNHRIVRILVSGCGDEDEDEVGFGYLLVCTMYSVHWYRVESEEEVEVGLKYLGCRVFKNCGVAGACWSPHLYEECLVLLENGELVLFDVSSRGGCKGTRFRVSWDEVFGGSGKGKGKWLGCEFGWHPRVFVVAHSNAVYMVDFRFGECEITCFAEVGMSKTYAKAGKDRFVVFCKADSEGYRYALATGGLLILCDVRKPLVPVLQWAHGLRIPCYIDVFRLSDLRANSTDDRFSWASEFGFGIVLGSFWDCEFSLFCYGPSSPSSGQHVGSELSKLCKSMYAWGLPTELSLSGRECGCGNCSVREEFSKDLLPVWIDWQTKKEIILGFGILSKDITMLLSDTDECGGFTLVRLMSSGKLESQRYGASWEFVKRSEDVHSKTTLLSEDNYLYDIGDEKYRFTRKFNYYKFDYLYSYMNGKLGQLLETNMKKSDMCFQDEDTFSQEIHEILCNKLKASGFGRFRSSPAVAVVFNDISSPTSIHEVALRRMWAGLPMNLLQLAFSNYHEFLKDHLDQKKIPLEFSTVPELCQLPPFLLKEPSCRSNRWSGKVPCNKSTLVGPALPLPVLLTLHELHNGCPNSEEEADGFSAEKEYDACCDEVMQVASEMAASDSGTEQHNGHCASLANNGEDGWTNSEKEKPFIMYHPCAVGMANNDQYSTPCREERYTKTIFKKSGKESLPNSKSTSVGLELFDDLCPVDLKFKGSTTSFTPKQLKSLNMLKKQFSKWQESFSPYKNFCEQSNL